MVKTVLVVDDAAFMRMALKTMLEKNGFKVIAEARNGLEGINKYMEHRPDLVTMDITMPEMNGIEALKQIMTFDKNANVIVASALGQEAYIKEAIVSGAKYFIVKPFKEEHVVLILNKIFDAQDGSAQKEVI